MKSIVGRTNNSNPLTVQVLGWFKDSEMELITGSAKIEELASWLEERNNVLHGVVEVIIDDAISFATTDGPQSSSRTTWRISGTSC